MLPDHALASGKPRRLGRVSLVGAGPGDPELMTVRAVQRLTEAELVLYDALVSEGALAWARQARRVCVGKRAGRPGVEQEVINRMLIRAARAGQRVVRLKCGDPFVLGRGGEELLALAEAGVTCEVVPGVSSALAAPALAGIPLTHRGLASGFVLVSGHAPESYGPLLDRLPPDGLTLVVLMGLANRGPIASQLLQNGWDPSMPSAILVAASTPASFTWSGPLEHLGAAAVPTPWAELPGILVVGSVAAIPEVAELAQARHASSTERAALRAMPVDPA
jgi:uroporphyrin-III C-methyltransferase/precorrin-2 dehydrogenase/sirohydrochlorin ferrochelatase